MPDLVDKTEFDKAQAYARELKAQVSSLDAEVFRLRKELGSTQRDLEAYAELRKAHEALVAEGARKDSVIAQQAAEIGGQRESVARAESTLALFKSVKDLLAKV